MGTAGPQVEDGMPRGLFLEKRTMARQVPPSKAVPAPPSAAIIALTRLGFGPSPTSVAEFQALGATDAQRFQSYIDQQLDPASIDDSAADARLAQSGFETLGKTVQQLWTEHLMSEDWSVVMQPFWETQLATWVRGVHSKRQLFELMVDFWHNHFNVFADDVPFGPVWVHTDRDAIRTHALGNFRQMARSRDPLPGHALLPRQRLQLLRKTPTKIMPGNFWSYIFWDPRPISAPFHRNKCPWTATAFPWATRKQTSLRWPRCLTGWTVNSQWVHWEFGQTGEFMYHAPWHDTGQ